MVERAIKVATTGWRPWALGAAALSMMGAAALWVWARRISIEDDEVYEAWWRHRDKVRANGSKAPDTYRTGNPQLFV